MADPKADFKPEVRTYLNSLYRVQGIAEKDIVSATAFMSHYTYFPVIPGNPTPEERLRALERIHLTNLGVKLD